MRPDRGGVKPERSGRTTKCMVDLDTGPWYSIAEPGGGLRSYPVLELRNTVEGGAMPTKRVVTRAFILSALAVALLAGAAGALEVGQKAPDFSLPGPDDKAGTVKFVKVLDNPLDLLNPDDVLKEVKASAS